MSSDQTSLTEKDTANYFGFKYNISWRQLQGVSVTCNK